MGIKIVAENKKARFDYHIIDAIEAGLVLKGSEVKSLRDNQCQLKDSYVIFKNDEAFLQNCHIAPYNAGGYANHPAERLRKLLLHKEQIKRLSAALNEKGYTLIPLKVYFKEGRAKVEIGLAKGKNKGDKRESAKTRDVSREIASSVRRSRKE